MRQQGPPTHDEQPGTQTRLPCAEIIRRLGPTISSAATAMLSSLENLTNQHHFQAWAIFSIVVFISYYRWPGRRVSLPSMR